MTCGFLLTHSDGHYYHHCACGYNPYLNGVTFPHLQVDMVTAHIWATRAQTWQYRHQPWKE